MKIKEIILAMTSEKEEEEGGAVLPEEEMFVKNLPGQMRHCGSLPSHERSHNPDKETRGEREEANDEEEEEEEAILPPSLSGPAPPS